MIGAAETILVLTIVVITVGAYAIFRIIKYFKN